MMSLEESVARQEEADWHLLSADRLWDFLEYKAEHDAENAWLRHAESLGWQEAFLEERHRWLGY